MLPPLFRCPLFQANETTVFFISPVCFLTSALPGLVFFSVLTAVHFSPLTYETSNFSSSLFSVFGRKSPFPPTPFFPHNSARLFVFPKFLREGSPPIWPEIGPNFFPFCVVSLLILLFQGQRKTFSKSAYQTLFRFL